MYLCNVEIKRQPLKRKKMKAKLYFIEDAIPRGEYKPTTLDEEKKNADMLLQSINGNYYSLWLNKDIEVKGRGVEHYGRIIVVTEKIYYKLTEKYTILTDF